MKTCRYSFFLLPGFFWAAGIFGAAQEAPEITSQQATVTFSSRVDLVSVPVVVRDGKGLAVGGLRLEDFRLFDQGKPQTILKFSVTQSGSAAAGTVTALRITEGTGTMPSTAPAATAKPPGPDRYVAYLFDDVHLNFENLAQIRAAAERHFASLAPTARAAIYTSSGRVTLDFTADRGKMHDALLQIAVAHPDSSADECPPFFTDYQADLIVNKGDPMALNAAAAEVRKCVPGISDGTALARSLANQKLGVNHIDTGASLRTLAAVVERLSVMPGSRSIVVISQGYMVLSDLRGRETDLMERAIHSNIVIGGLNARGLYTNAMGELVTTRDGGFSPRARYRFDAAQADEKVMAELADGTGGKFFHNDNGLLDGLNRLAALPEYSYVLGFSPQNLKLDGSYHSLKVTLVNSKGTDMQARHGYWAPDHAADAAERSKEEIREAVFSLEEVRDIPVDVTTEFFKSSDSAAELTVDSHVDLNSLKFRASADRSENTLTLVTGLFDQDGRYVKGMQRVIGLRLREQTLAKVLASGMAFRETFDVAPGRYVVRVVLRDSEGQTMAARNATVDMR